MPAATLDRTSAPKDHPVEEEFSAEAEVLRILRHAAGQPTSEPELRAADSFYVLQKTLADKKKKMTEYEFMKTLADQKKNRPLQSDSSLPEERGVSVATLAPPTPDKATASTAARSNDHLIPCRELPIPRAPPAAPSIPQQRSSPPQVAGNLQRRSSSPQVPASTATAPAGIEISSVLQYLDKAWQDHIDAIDHLRDSMNLRGLSEESDANTQCSRAQKATEGRATFRSLHVEGPEQTAGTVKNSNSL